MAALGAALSLVIVMTIVGVRAQFTPETDGRTVPPPRAAPDYLATIQAPTPTSEPGGADGVGERTTWVGDQDIARMTTWMKESTWVQAMAVGSEGNATGLERSLRQGIAAHCRPRMEQSIEAMVATGRMLSPTESLAIETGQCIQEASGNRRGNDGAETGENEVRTLLIAHSHGSNPATTMTAAQPSPENMAFWRTVWPHQENCRIRATERAQEITASDDAESLEIALRAAFAEIEACLTEATDAFLTGQQNP